VVRSLYNSSHAVDDLSHVSSNFREQSADFAVPHPVGIGWTTLAVKNRNSDIENCPVVLHIRRRTVANHREDFCAVFDFSGISDFLPVAAFGKFADEAYVPLCNGAESQSDQVVLVRIVHVAEDSEERRELFVRSILRLYPLNSCPHGGAYIPKSSNVECLPEVFGRISDRESIVGIPGRVGGGFVTSDGVNKVIQGGTKVGKAVRKHQAPPLKRGRLIDAKEDAVSSVVRVSLSRDTIWVSVKVGPDFILDGLSVFLRPGYFCANVGQVEQHMVSSVYYCPRKAVPTNPRETQDAGLKTGATKPKGPKSRN